MNYGAAEKKSIKYSFSGGLEVRFIHLDDLVVNKMLTGRLQDKADVDILQQIKRVKGKKIIKMTGPTSKREFLLDYFISS